MSGPLFAGVTIEGDPAERRGALCIAASVLPSRRTGEDTAIASTRFGSAQKNRSSRRPKPQRRLKAISRASQGPHRRERLKPSAGSITGATKRITPMSLFAFLLFGGGAYGLSFATILYSIGFVANLWVPKGIDSG